MNPAGAACAILAALLFGSSFALGKPLLRSADPLALAGLYYASSGLGLALLAALRRRPAESLRRADLGWLAGAVLAGGVLAPVLSLLGLQRTPAAAAALLAGTEPVFTLLLAALLLGESLSRRELLGLGTLLAGSAAAAFPDPGGAAEARGWSGPLLLAASYLLWATDNTLTQRISARDPVQIAAVKGLVAGAINLALAWGTGARFPGAAGDWILAAGVGLLCYGVSLALFVVALRRLGAARAAALFGMAPVFGAAVAWPLLGEAWTWRVAAGAAAVLLGIALMSRPPGGHEAPGRAG